MFIFSAILITNIIQMPHPLAVKEPPACTFEERLSTKQ